MIPKWLKSVLHPVEDAACLFGMQAVSKRVVWLSVLLGFVLSGLMALGYHPLIAAFTTDGSVRSAIMCIFPIVILTQPLNALAFVWDGVLYGAGGFAYAAKAMPLCALPSVLCMLGSTLSNVPDKQLLLVWAGLTLLMLMRTLSVWVPFRLGSYPFEKLQAKGQTTAHEQTQTQ